MRGPARQHHFKDVEPTINSSDAPRSILSKHIHTVTLRGCNAMFRQVQNKPRRPG